MERGGIVGAACRGCALNAGREFVGWNRGLEMDVLLKVGNV